MALPQPDIPRPNAPAADVVEFLEPHIGSVITWVIGGDERRGVVTEVINSPGSPYVTVAANDVHGDIDTFDWDLSEWVYLVATPAGQPYEEVDR